MKNEKKKSWCLLRVILSYICSVFECIKLTLEGMCKFVGPREAFHIAVFGGRGKEATPQEFFVSVRLS